MKLTIGRDELLRGAGRVQGIVDRRGTLPILTNVLIRAEPDRLCLAATDLEVGVIATAIADVVTPGAVTLGAKKLYEIVRAVGPGPLTIEQEDASRVRIVSGTSRFSLLSVSAEEYPSLPSAEGVEMISLDGGLLAEMIDRTFYATCTDETRYNLNGIFVEVLDDGRLCFVATDGHRLAKVERATREKIELFGAGRILPRKGVAEIRKLCEEGEGDVELGLADGVVLARRAGLLLWCRLIDSEYPDYRQVLPAGQTIRVTLEREQLLHAARRIALVSSDRASGFSFTLEDGELLLVAANPDLGEAREQLTVDYVGPKFDTRLDARYVIDALGAMSSKEIVIEFINQLAPAQIRPPDDPHQVAVIMPMRL
jgi:DNA polymerase III subunit beta